MATLDRSLGLGQATAMSQQLAADLRGAAFACGLVLAGIPVYAAWIADTAAIFGGTLGRLIGYS